ncbi:MAG: family 20 glycosylhydrolase, partial [Alistipes sp.]|nr:family 20 glycosylhydrolase [Alistipes sp.]
MRSRWRWVVLLGVMGWSLTGYAAPGLIPLPNHMELREGRFLVNRTTEIYAPQDSALGRWLNDRIEQVCGYRLPMATHRRPLQQIVLLREASLPEEGYTLEIVSGHVRLCGRDRAGLFYGLQTLLQWMPASVYRTEKGGVQAVIDLEGVRIEDAPRFPYRGVMLDVSRNFFDAATVKQYIDWMAVHKLNRLHWHLTDDNGWRIEILSHPELTTKGAWRGPGEVLPPSYGSGCQRYGGYYTQAEIRDIVRYAEARNVTIIPEIDLPGHS